MGRDEPKWAHISTGHSIEAKRDDFCNLCKNGPSRDQNRFELKDAQLAWSTGTAASGHTEEEK